MLGGILWLPYGLFTMLQPWGVDVAYREAQGYSVVVDKTLFVAYSVPGALALVLASIGLLTVVAQLSGRRGTVARATCVLGYVALALGSASFVGVIALFDPMFTAGRIFGTLALGVATTMAAVLAHQGNAHRAWVIGLILLGALGVFLLPLWPLVYALRWLTPGQAASFIAVFGAGWLAVGYQLLREANHLESEKTPVGS